MSCLDELLDKILEASACFCRVTVFLVEGTSLAMISLGWVRSEGFRTPEVGQTLDHRKKFFI